MMTAEILKVINSVLRVVLLGEAPLHEQKLKSKAPPWSCRLRKQGS